MTNDSQGQAGTLTFQVSPQEFDRALDLLCAYSSDGGFSLGDLLAAILLKLGAKLPSSVSIENALSLLHELDDG